MVVREGAELVLILRAVELSSAGVEVWIGTALGIAIAVAVGVFFFQGTLKIPLHRFFAATSVILMVVAFQLALTGVARAQRSDVDLVEQNGNGHDRPDRRQRVFLFCGDSRRNRSGCAARMVHRKGVPRRIRQSIRPNAACANGNSAGSAVGASPLRSCASSWCFRWPRSLSTLTPRIRRNPRKCSSHRQSSAIPLSDLTDASVHFYTADVSNTVLRFLVIHQTNGDYATALDACQICGGPDIARMARTWSAAIAAPRFTFPRSAKAADAIRFPVKSRVDAGEVVVDLSALASACPVHP